MTVNLEIPKIAYTGNGTTTDYTFKWSCGDPNENYVKLNGVLLTEGIQYELEDFTLEFGGTMVFNTAPVVGDDVFVYRMTPITQQVDYVDFEPFPADTHEFQLDKDTRILQELIFGAAAFGGQADLASVPFPTYVEITNTAGTNAQIDPWTIDGLLSGVFRGEVVPSGQDAPLDGNPTAMPDGYIWWELGPLPTAGGNINLTLLTNETVVNSQKTSPTQSQAEFRYQTLDGDIQYGYDSLQPLVAPLWTTEEAIRPVPNALLQYWIKFDITSGSVDALSAATGTWIDAWANSGDANPYSRWFVTDPGTTGAVEGTFTVTSDDGGGSPDLTVAITRAVKLTAVQT